ncbi:MAG TPA: FAD:protein FMN transferase [Acidimicrobiia bacterium]|jgi:thiamine biosynthesis lipoprotein
MPADATFAVMGATAEVTVVGGARALLELARGRLTDLERRWSRFVPTSEISRLNRAQGLPVRVSSETRLLVRRALDGYAVTNGRFDPTLLGAVLRAGYVESFDRLGARPRRSVSRLVTGAHRIEVDEQAGTVRIPLGVGFDPGGIGKGLAADLVAEELLAFGAAGVCVNVGGDVRVCGAAPDGAAWRIAVDSPWDGSAPLAELRLHDGAVATSSRLRRRWVDEEGAEQHHLVDPATGASARSPVLAATAVASLGWRAEVLAKAAFLDAAQGLDLVDRLGAAAVVVVPDGLLTSAGWPALTAAPRSEATS